MVRATDSEGNVDQSPASYRWTVEPPDTTAPETTIDSGPEASTTDTEARFTFSSDEQGATFRCSLDEGAFEACTSPHDVRALEAGQHRLRVEATDQAGNADESPASHTWTVEPPADTTAPETTIDSGPSGVIHSNAATFEFSSSEGGSSFECKLDGGAFESCSSPKTYNELSTGDHSFRVRATDAAGNADASEATRAFTVDLGYARPQAGANFRVPMVVAYEECTSPDSEHQGALAGGSCTAHDPKSDFVTIRDADGTTHSSGFVRFNVQPGTPPTSDEDADIELAARVTDVRSKADLSDYAGELQGQVQLRVTDKHNGSSGVESATVEDLAFDFAVPCAPTVDDPAIGSECSISTTFDGVTPGVVIEGRRSNWGLGPVRFFDGGGDGLAATTGDNTLFETQGLFIP
jgi:hypothetical protein